MCWERWDCLDELLLKGKVIHVHVMKGRGGSGLQLHAFLPLAVDGASGHLHAPTVLSLGKQTPVPTEWQGRYTTELLLTLWRRDKSLPLPGIEQSIRCSTLGLITLLAMCSWFHSTKYCLLLTIFYLYMPLNIDLLTFRLVFFVFTLGVYVSEDWGIEFW
jgi:hypothetical protein